MFAVWTFFLYWISPAFPVERGFDYEGALLLVTREERIAGPKLGGSCPSWVEALRLLSDGSRMGRTQEQKGRWFRDWEPWNKEDLEAIESCDRFPCKIKLDRAEVDRMSRSPKSARRTTWMDLVRDRASRYLEARERRGYGLSGDPIDPWSTLERHGFVSGPRRPEAAELWVRRLDFAPGKMRPNRQVIDRRFASSAEGGVIEAALWIRDIYSAHYFDSWGEWLRLQCRPLENRVTVTQALLVELDLLKKTDFLSRLARGKLRRAVEENGGAHLDRVLRELRARVERRS